MAADEIVLLRGLINAQTTDSDIFTLDGAGEAYEAVKTYNVSIPPTASGTNVIFNGNYDADGARHHVRVDATKVTSYAAGVPTKTENTELLGWATIDPDSATSTDRIKQTGVEDIAAGVLVTLHITVAISEAEATTGLEIIVEIRARSTGDMSTLTRWVGPIGTAVKSDFAGNEAAAQTTLSVTNPTTGKLNNVGKYIFIEHTTDITKCEVGYIIECGADA